MDQHEPLVHAVSPRDPGRYKPIAGRRARPSQADVKTLTSKPQVRNVKVLTVRGTLGGGRQSRFGARSPLAPHDSWDVIAEADRPVEEPIEIARIGEQDVMEDHDGATELEAAVLRLVE